MTSRHRRLVRCERGPAHQRRDLSRPPIRPAAGDGGRVQPSRCRREQLFEIFQHDRLADRLDGPARGSRASGRVPGPKHVYLRAACLAGRGRGGLRLPPRVAGECRAIPPLARPSAAGLAGGRLRPAQPGRGRVLSLRRHFGTFERQRRVLRAHAGRDVGRGQSRRGFRPGPGQPLRPLQLLRRRVRLVEAASRLARWR